MPKKLTTLKSNYSHIVLWVVLLVIVYLAVHHFLTAFVGSVTGQYAPIKVAKDIVVFTAFVLTLLYSLWFKNIRQVIWTDFINIAIVTYMCLHASLMIALDLTSNKAAIAGIIFDLRFLAAFFIVRVLLLHYIKLAKNLALYAGQLLITIGVTLAFIGILQVIALPKDFMSIFGYDGINTIPPFSMVDNRDDTLRAFATMRTPNDFGAYLILPITLSLFVFLKKQKVLYLLYATLMSIGLWLTYSRSAMIGCFIAIVVLIVAAFYAHITRRIVYVCLIAAVTGLAATIIAVDSVPSVRVAILHSSETDSSLIEGSTADHIVATKQGINDVIQNPFGYGPGQAGPASFYKTDKQPKIAENYYVQIGQEAGVIGAALFVLICTTIGLRLVKYSELNELRFPLLASLIGLSTTAVFLHTWADESVAYTWWIIAAIVFSTLPARRLHLRKGGSFTDKNDTI